MKSNSKRDWFVCQSRVVDITGHQRKMGFIGKEEKRNNEMNHGLCIFQIHTQAVRQKKIDLSDD